MTFFFALLIKHAIVDLGIQSHVKGLDKSRYFSNAHIHYAHHGISTFIIALFFVDPIIALLCAIIDYTAHWHIDFAKHRVNTHFELEARSIAWWWTNSADAALHFITYYAIVQFAL
ncbi:MAG: hypothetical protein VXZ76_03150 [Bacteroidota bacterium]|nr:hypothetical protein [Bacteroidota bacterium]